MRQKAVTLLQVAELAGVSTATINRVIRGDSHVLPDTKAKVEDVLRTTGYRPNAAARNLRTRRTSTIGQMITSITANPFFVGVTTGVEAAAEAAGYRTFIFNHDNDPVRERIGLEGFIAQGVDAILFCTSTLANNVELVRKAGIPVVEIERSLVMDTPFVRIDNVSGARAAMKHLVDLGHRRIAFVGGDPMYFHKDARRGRSVEDDRLLAYHQGMAVAGLSEDDQLIRLGRYYPVDNTSGSSSEGRHHAEALLSLDHPPTAIFATCDILAAGVLQAIYARGLRVPDDISVIGYDDTLAANLTPSLTTVAQPMTAVGTRAFEIALSMINGIEPQNLVEFQTELRVRDSTRVVIGR